MLKKIFFLISLIGTLLISILAFVIPKDPYITVPSVLFFDKPLWLCIIIVGTFSYLILLSILYNTIEEYNKK